MKDQEGMTLIQAQACVSMYDNLKEMDCNASNLVKQEAILRFVHTVAVSCSSFAPIAKEILKMCPDSHDIEKRP